MIGLTDSHCHLSAPEFGDLEEVLARSRSAGVDCIIAVGYTLETSRRAIEIARAHPEVWATVGVSPHDASNAPTNLLPSLERLAADNLDVVVAIGETGLDFYHTISPRNVQIEAFVQHIRAARNLGLPLIVHTRNAFDKTLQVLIDNKATRAPGVLHCFTGTAEEARRGLELGFYISFSGIITFPKADEVRQTAASVPEERLLIETDAPYLAPVPKRGIRNEPANLRYVAEALCKITNSTIDQIARVTATNAARLFRLKNQSRKSSALSR